MRYELRCGDVISGCDGVVTGDAEEEVLGQAAAHASEVHGLVQLDDATVAAVSAAIHPVG